MCFSTRRTVRPDSVRFVLLDRFERIWGHFRDHVPDGTAIRIAIFDIDITPIAATIVVTNFLLAFVFELNNPNILFIRKILSSEKSTDSTLQKIFENITDYSERIFAFVQIDRQHMILSKPTNSTIQSTMVLAYCNPGIECHIGLYH